MAGIIEVSVDREGRLPYTLREHEVLAHSDTAVVVHLRPERLLIEDLRGHVTPHHEAPTTDRTHRLKPFTVSPGHMLSLDNVVAVQTDRSGVCVVTRGRKSYDREVLVGNVDDFGKARRVVVVHREPDVAVGRKERGHTVLSHRFRRTEVSGSVQLDLVRVLKHPNDEVDQVVVDPSEVGDGEKDF